MNKAIRILSTKKLQPNQRQYLLNAELSIVEANYIETENIPFELKEIHDNLIFTSQNAVNSVLKHPEIEKLKSKNVFCVGLKTKILLSESGFQVDAYTNYAADLAEIISLVYGTKNYTFFSGTLRKDTLPEILTESGVVFNEINVYATTLKPQKNEVAVDGILFFSPSAVQSYLQQNKIKNEICFCIGETTAEALSKTTKNIVIANQPSVENTIIQCINYYSNTL
ncbi:uroporphyrinogen-III synthase [Flavobacterium agrisoli]|uniref:Uroporphyrinogen-III synthase n=1 Tax=Flavobacterium agrisoli TaxID=2793066 RepID=A0A934PLA2_9FLAO|nr:uroporphyrinogen-III synthase [Flavobacterium agrisoli]MBK0369682.1 uroporphyrinogen-III synthase [Flavobacterium agrisoli]